MDCIPGSDNELLQVLQRLALGEDRVQISDVVPKPGLHDSTCCVVLGAFRGTGDGRRCSQRVRRVGHEMQKNMLFGSTSAPSSIRRWPPTPGTEEGRRPAIERRTALTNWTGTGFSQKQVWLGQ